MARTPSPAPGRPFSYVAALLWLSLAACGSGTAMQAADKIAPAVTAAAEKLEAGTPLDSRQARSDGDGRLEVYVYVTSSVPENMDALAARGLKGGTVNAAMGLAQGWAYPHDLDALAALPYVTRITLPQYAVPR